jgi:hypothetical protein
VELIRKDKEKFRSARKIPPSGKQALANKFLHAIPFRNVNNHVNIFSEMLFFYA